MRAPTEARLRLLHAGFSPLPVKGKHPQCKEWEKKSDSNVDEIKLWGTLFQYADNTGILTARVPAFDIDILDEAAAQAVEDLVRERLGDREGEFLVRVGKPPKRAVLFQTDTPFKKIQISLEAPDGSPDQKLEFLGDGQQIVVFGIHKDTQQPYTWIGREPGDVPRDALPHITEAEARDLVEAAAQLLIAEHGYRPIGTAAPRPAPNGHDPAPRLSHSSAEPREWDDDLANIAAGRELHDSIASLAMKLLRAGMADGAAVNFLRAQMETSAAPRNERWQERVEDIPRAVKTARQKIGEKPPPAEQKTVTVVEIYDAGDDTALPPPRPWLMGAQFCKRFLSSIIAPGGVGKTALRMLQFVALATGNNLTGQHVFGRYRVLLLSFEDDIDELRRRLAAIRIHHGIDPSQLKGQLFYATPRGLKLAQMNGNSRQIGDLEKWLRKKIAELKPDIIGLDPFVKLHALEENSNGEMDFVCDLLTRLAIEFDIAIDVPHHSRKGSLTPGDAESGRGASGVKDAGRLVSTLTVMSPEEAETFGIRDEERPAYIRLDPAKVNIVTKAQRATWFKLIGVPLGNGTPEYPNGDEVQTVIPWNPPDLWTDLSVSTLNLALNEIDRGLPNGQRYSGAASAKERAAWSVVRRHCPDKTEQQCRKVIKTWLENGVLYQEEYDDPIHRKPRNGLRVNSTKRPGQPAP